MVKNSYEKKTIVVRLDKRFSSKHIVISGIDVSFSPRAEKR